jgi:hypothetical protein
MRNAIARPRIYSEPEREDTFFSEVVTWEIAVFITQVYILSTKIV